MRLSGKVELVPRQLNVQALFFRACSDHTGLVRCLGQVRQTVWQLQLCGLRIGQAELPHQLFTRCCGRVLCRSQLRYRLGIKALLPRPLQLVEIACLLHAARQFRTGLGRRIDLLRILQALLSGHRPHPGLAHLGDLVNHGGAELNLGLCNLALCDGLTSRQGQQLQQTKGQQAADL